MDNIITVLQETSEETKSQTELNSEKLFKLIILGQETQNKELNEEVQILKNEISHLKEELDIQGVKTSELYQTLQKTESFNNRLQINLNSMENNAELLKIELAEAKDESEKSSRLNILLKEKIGREMQLHQTLKERFKESESQRQMIIRKVSSLEKKSKAQGQKISELNGDLQKTESVNNRLNIYLNNVEKKAELLKIELSEAKDEIEQSSRLNILLKEKIGREMQLHQALNERFRESESQRQKMIKEKFENSIVISEYNHNTGQHEDSSLCPERKEIYNKLAVANFRLKRAESKTLKVSSALFFCFLCFLCFSCFSLYFYYIKPSENPFDEILRLKSEREELSDEINKLRQKIIFQSVALLCCVPLAVRGLHIWGLF